MNLNDSHTLELPIQLEVPQFQLFPGVPLEFLPGIHTPHTPGPEKCAR